MFRNIVVSSAKYLSVALALLWVNSALVTPNTNSLYTGLVVFTTNCNPGDAHKRLLRSANEYEYNVQILGTRKQCRDTSEKFELVQNAVREYNNNNPNTVILFIEGPNAILTAGPQQAIEAFETTNAGILISSEEALHENEIESDRYQDEDRFSTYNGGFISTVGKIMEIMQEFPNARSLQELLSKAYSKSSLRKRHVIKIDSSHWVFQQLNDDNEDVMMQFSGREAMIRNTDSHTKPIVIMATTEDSVIQLNNFGSYLANSWNEEDGCKSCSEDRLDIGSKYDEVPFVTIAVFIESATAFIDEFFENLENLKYPKDRMHLFIHNNEESHAKKTNSWVKKMKSQYRDVKYITADEVINKGRNTRNEVLKYCLNRDCSYVFMVTSDTMLTNPQVLRHLIGQNRQIIAPMLVRPDTLWSNFWGALNTDGYYARSFDYLDIVNDRRRGLWNVPHINSCFLIQRSLIADPNTKPNFVNKDINIDLALCHNLRKQGVFMYVSNQLDFGYMLSDEEVDDSKSELWNVIGNSLLWEKRYLHENYSQSINESNVLQQPCPDVFLFPIFNEKFTEEIILMMKNNLDSGYKQNPRNEMPFDEVDFEAQWLYIMRTYVTPLQLRVYTQYEKTTKEDSEAFVARYSPDKQPSLTVHDDPSTYTINIALNSNGLDYQGGGNRFDRYDCKVMNPKVGWMVMYPGRALTHRHEGLAITKGTQYIIVSYINPSD